MLKKGMSKVEIEKELQGRGDFVQIDYLSRYVKESIPIDIKKFCGLKLAELYEKREMFSEAAKVYDSLAIFATTYADKIKYYIKSTEFYIKSGFFDNADAEFKKSLGSGNIREREEMMHAIKDFYKRQAGVYEKEQRRANAIKIYEKMLVMNISESEREEIKKRLLELYEKTGRLKEFFALKTGRFGK